MSTIQSQPAADNMNVGAVAKKSEIFEKINARIEKHGDMFSSMLSKWTQSDERAGEGRFYRMQNKLGTSSVLLSTTDTDMRQKALEEEEERKEEDKKKLEAERRNQELERSQELQQEDLAKMAINAAANQADSPFARLVSSLAASGTASNASSTSGSGTLDANGSALGAGAGNSGNQSGSATVSGASGKVNGFASADPNSSGAQAALQMANISDDSVNIEQDLNRINQKNLSAVPVNQEPSLSERLYESNNSELRQNLDNLAKASSVSKLSLQMANPQTQAQSQSNAAAVANLPTSGNKLAGLTGAAASPASGPASGPTSVDTTKTQANALATTESVLKYRQSQPSQTAQAEQNTKSKELLQMTENSRVAVEKQALSRASHVSSTPRMVDGVSSGSRTANLDSASHVARTNNAGAQSSTSTTTALAGLQSGTRSAVDGFRVADSVSSGAELGRNVGSRGLGTSGSALLASVRQQSMAQNLALAGSANVGTSSQALSGMASAGAEAALSLNASAQNSAMQQALTSLKQGMGLQPVYTQGYDPRNYAGNLVANAVDASNSGNESSLDNSLQDQELDAASTSASAAASASANASKAFSQMLNAQTSPSASASAAMSMHPSAAENAQEIHEKVMQMAARNLKQLSIDLSPNQMGRMRIDISLDKENDALSVSLAAAHPQTRALLKQALPQLREILASQNISAEEQVYELEDVMADGQGKGQVEGMSELSRNLQTSQEFFAQRRIYQREQA